MDLLLALPIHDVLFPKILDFLSIKEVFLLREVSKKYQTTVDEYFMTCRKLQLAEHSCDVTPEAFLLMTKKNNILQELNLNNSKHWLDDNLFLSVVCKCPMLKNVDITNCSRLTNRSLHTLASYCKFLTTLSIHGCHWIDKDTFKVVISSNRNLIDVDASGCWSLDDDCIITMASKCTNLKKLALVNVYPITDRSIESLALNCKHLTTLKVSGCWRITNTSIGKIGEYCKKLHLLHVKDCRDISESSLARLRVRNVVIDKPVPPKTFSRRLLVQPYVNLQV
ncbi:uncharacterized protein LOC100178899 [Ciona intestinalis]